MVHVVTIAAGAAGGHRQWCIDSLLVVLSAYLRFVVAESRDLEAQASSASQ